MMSNENDRPIGDDLSAGQTPALEMGDAAEGRNASAVAPKPSPKIAAEPSPASSTDLSSAVHAASASTLDGANNSASSTDADMATEIHRLTGCLGEPGPVPPLFTVPGYSSLQLLGQGGMGQVYKARHDVLGRTVAIKVPLGAEAGSESRARFLREARSAARLRNPSICPIHEIGEADARPYMVLAYIEGETLEARLQSQSMDPIQAARLTTDLALAIQYAHEQGIVHRDLKPANIMLEAGTGQPLVLDFGLAKELTEENSDLTRTGQIMGTPSYMAPEQARGQIEWVGPKSDVYALGAILYRMLAGKRPFEGPIGEVLRAVQADQPKLPRSINPRVPRDLETICLKAMAKHPLERYETAGALAQDLQRYLAGEPIRARRTPLAMRGWQYAKRNPAMVTAFLIAMVSVVTAAFFVSALSEAGAALTEAEGRRLARQTFLQSVSGVRESTSPAEVARRAAAWLATAQEPSEQQEVRRSVVDALAGELEAGLAERDTTSAQFARLIEITAILKTWDESQAADFQRRIDRLTENFFLERSLEPPFGNLEQVFPKSHWTVVGDALSPKPQAPTQLPFQAPGDRPVQLTAVFIRPEGDVGNCGFSLDAGPHGHYQFLLHYRPAIRPHEILGWHVVVRRGTSDLASWPAPKELAGARQVVLTATCDGPLMSIQIGDAASGVTASFNDWFRPYGPARYGLVMPPTAQLQRLVIAAKVSHPAASRFPAADELVRAGKFQPAISLYQAAPTSATPGSAPASGPEPIGAAQQEANFKSGYCLFRSGQYEEAALALSLLASEAGQVWPRLALAYSAAIHARLGRFEEALRMLPKHAGGKPERGLLVESLSAAERYDVGMHIVTQLGATDPLFGGGGLTPEFCLQAANVLTQLGAIGPADLAHYQLARAYQFRSQSEAGLQAIRRVEFPDAGACRTHLQLLREVDRTAESLALCQQWIGDEAGTLSDRREVALVEEAICFARLARWEEAEAAVRRAQDAMEAWVRQWPRDQVRPQLRSDNEFIAALLLGCLLERRGDLPAAQAAWAVGVGSPQSLIDKALSRASRWTILAMAALSDRLDTATLDALVGESFQSRETGGAIRSAFMVYGAEGGSQRFAPVFHRAFQRPAARQFVRDLAFGHVAHADSTWGCLQILIAETGRELSVKGRTTRAQDPIFDEAARLANRDFGAQAKADPLLLAQLVMAAKGTLGSFGWSTAAARLKADTRVHIAYLFGCWRLRVGKLDEGRSFLKECKTHSPADAPISKLAAAQLAAIEAGTGLMAIENTAPLPLEITILASPPSAAPQTHRLAAGEQLTLQLPPGTATVRWIPTDAPVRAVETLLPPATIAASPAPRAGSSPAGASPVHAASITVGCWTPVFLVPGP